MLEKIPVVLVPDRPYFFLPTLLFFNAIDRATLFSRVVAGCCQNGVCCHTNYWKKHEKNIQKKNYFRPTDPNLIFSRYETRTTGIFFTPNHNEVALHPNAPYFIISHCLTRWFYLSRGASTQWVKPSMHPTSWIAHPDQNSNANQQPKPSKLV
jgi:hypothetical protein